LAVGFSVKHGIFYAVYLENLLETLYPSSSISFLHTDWFQHKCMVVHEKQCIGFLRSVNDISGFYHIRTANRLVLYTAVVAILAVIQS
jgi:hypothetical protein